MWEVNDPGKAEESSWELAKFYKILKNLKKFFLIFGLFLFNFRLIFEIFV